MGICTRWTESWKIFSPAGLWFEPPCHSGVAFAAATGVRVVASQCRTEDRQGLLVKGCRAIGFAPHSVQQGEIGQSQCEIRMPGTEQFPLHRQRLSVLPFSDGVLFFGMVDRGQVIEDDGDLVMAGSISAAEDCQSTAIEFSCFDILSLPIEDRGQGSHIGGYIRMSVPERLLPNVHGAARIGFSSCIVAAGMG